MFSGYYAVVRGVLIVVAVALGGNVSGEKRAGPLIAKTRSNPRGVAVKNIKLNLTAITPSALPGESLVARFELVNSGMSPVSAPAPGSYSAFSFEVRAAMGGGEPRILSYADTLHQRFQKDMFRPSVPAMAPLKPGTSVKFETDLAELILDVLAPGDYLVSVRYAFGADEQLESEPKSFTISSPSLVRSVAAFEADGEIVQAQSHGAPGAAVLRRDVKANELSYGTWYRHVQAKEGANVTGVAVAMETPARQPLRWFSWMDGETLSGATSARSKVFEHAQPATLRMVRASLYPIGWQPNCSEATFIVMGTDRDGRIAILTVRFRSAASSETKAAPLSLSTFPLHWAARYDVASTALDLVAAEPKGSGARIVQQTCSPAKGASEKQIVLFETPEPIVALALDPEPVANAVDVLLGPVGKPEPKMTLLRLPLGGGAPLATWHFGLPRPGVPKMWAITLPSTGAPVVLASDGQRIDALQPGNGAAWVKIEEAVGAATHLTALTFADKGVWASWFDSHGARFARAR